MELEVVARRRRALAAPVGVAAVAVTAAAVLHFRDPHSAGSYGVCPMYALTGLWCPACGGLRAVNDLTNLDVGAAVSSNVLIVPFVAVLVIAWIGWTVRRWKGTRDRMIVLRPTVTIVVLGVLVAFTVVRNTPWGSWLAPA
ncbi:DUF2752 domain-containing protein [Rhodococcus erythropolis]|jgi:hypothetical protein|uniref:DUF2752 domain-containing protein n=1 Tax=Rhodococcus TaxID=1827 RepID=UPI0007672E0D|nr:DUF2752 domain-containing protein [Rhodococcus erythropolis]MBO8148817.1 DUF2752 domain-containing protein [Rhodococcus erythropolis]MDO1491200.1 DUF2752 domain-containing protein [Rhodococcus erythropolis]QSE41759.1 DUF2752 domain-containing protein [Rhodococcus erythropolis]